MLAGDIFQNFHGELVIVGSDVGRAENRCQFVLRRSDFVMLCFGIDAQFPQFLIQIVHEGLNTRFNRAEVMIF